MTSRERFEAWVGAEWIAFHEQPSEGMAIRKVFQLDPYDVWQAAEEQAVKRCAEIAGKLSVIHYDVYWVIRDQYALGMSDGAEGVENSIHIEFSEAFK